MAKAKRKSTRVEGAESINLTRRLYWSERYGPGVITNLQDAFGDFTDDEAEARFAVVKIHEACWISVDLRNWNLNAPPLH